MFFKETADLQKYLKINITSKIASIVPYINDAAPVYLLPYLGNDLYDKLIAWYDLDDGSTDDNNDVFEKLLPKVQNVLAKFTILLAAPSLDVQLQESGFGVVQTDKVAPASTARVKALEDSMEKLGYMAIDNLLEFLEKNKDDYADWTNSSAYTETYKNFITNTSMFDKMVKIGNSRLKFMELIPVMDNVEMLIIEPKISKELCDEIKGQIKVGEISELNAAILPKIRYAIANFVAFDQYKDNKYENLANNFLMMVVNTLDGAPDDYPLYKASSAYEATKTSNQSYDNSADNTIYVFN